MKLFVRTLTFIIFLHASTAAQTQLQVGYAVQSIDAGTRLPVGSALFSYRNDSGVLVSEAGVGSADPIRFGRMFVDEEGTQTGVALVNFTAVPASAVLILRNANGREISRITQGLAPRQHITKFVRELFPGVSNGFTGSLTFDSNQPIAALTLRESRNAQGEPLYTTLPVVDLGAPSSTESIVFPHLAAGGGYTTQILLMNRESQSIRGSIRLLASDGRPLVLRLNGNGVTDISYQIEPHGTYRAELDNLAGLTSGYAIVTPEPGSVSPSGAVVFQYKRDGQVVTEAGVVATSPTLASRIFVDHSGTHTGVALANPSSQSANLTITLLDRNGVTEATSSRTIAAGGHLAIFVEALFPSLMEGFTGIMEISSSAPLASITLKLTTNSRNDFIVTTLPIADLARLPASSSRIFPQLVSGEGFSTRLIFINGERSTDATGRLNFYQSDGSPMNIAINGLTVSQATYSLSAGGGRQMFPGNPARVASISVLDSVSGRATSEVVVNEGNTVRPRLRIVDTAGAERDDFDVTHRSISTDIAAIDPAGRLRGLRAGFSTLTFTAGGVIAIATATVVRVDSRVSGFVATGIAQDAGRRLYLASSQDHTILLAEEGTATPAVYAGISRSAGLRNDLRLQSLFREPSYLAFNHADGTLYVSDSRNSVIRRVRPGPEGRVETFAAGFNNPQGIALDDRGNLWLADSADHTIKRIRLSAGVVETIAGLSGAAGSTDGIGREARFRFPVGIAVERESAVQELERQRTGAAPPTVRVIVTDSGNGILRRVSENGGVETIRSDSAAAGIQDANGRKIFQGHQNAPIAFANPTSVATDSFENIYIVEPDSGNVWVFVRRRAILVRASEAGSFRSPRGVVVSDGGRFVVSDASGATREIRYGGPQITSVTPNRIVARGGESVTISGRNFAPDSIVIISGTIISNAVVVDTQTITLTAPPLPSGRGIITVQNRAGIGQAALLIDGVPLSALPAGYITTVVGGSTFAGEGSAATAAPLRRPSGIATDSDGNIYVADADHRRIRKIDRVTGVITTIAGTGVSEVSGDGGPATAAGLSFATDVVLDSTNNIFIADNGFIRKVDAATGVITTVAGRGTVNYSGDGGPATAARIGSVTSIAIDSAGNLFIADDYNHVIRKIEAATQIITTVAGIAGRNGLAGDNISAVNATLNRPSGVAVDSAGNVFISDYDNNRVRRVDGRTGIITTVASGITQPLGVSVDRDDNVLFCTSSSIRRIDFRNGSVTTVAGNSRSAPDATQVGDNGPATSAYVDSPTDALGDSAGNILIADTRQNRIRRVDGRTRIITTIAGTGEEGHVGDGGPAIAASLFLPSQVIMDGRNNLYISDGWNRRVRIVDRLSGIIRTVAGTGGCCSRADNVPATSSEFYLPSGMAFDTAGNLYVVDTLLDQVRRIDAVTQQITTVVGLARQRGFAGDGAPAIDAQLNLPGDIVIDSAGNLFIADEFNHRIRRVDAVARTISTYAGTGAAGSSGDGGAAAQARLERPNSLVLDGSGNLYIGQTGRVRKVDRSTGIISTVYEGYVDGIALDPAGTLYVSEFRQIRRVDLRTRTNAIVAGTLSGSVHAGVSGDNRPATEAKFSGINDIYFDNAGNLYVVDWIANRVRAIRGPIP